MMPRKCFENDESFILYVGLLKHPRPITSTMIFHTSARYIPSGVAREILEDFVSEGYVERTMEGRGRSKMFVISPSIPPNLIRVKQSETEKYIKRAFNVSDIHRYYGWKSIYTIQSAVISKIMKSMADVDLTDEGRDLKIEDLMEYDVPIYGFAVNIVDVLDEIKYFASLYEYLPNYDPLPSDWREKGFMTVKLLSGSSVLKFDGTNVSLVMVLEPAFTTKLHLKKFV